MTPNLIERLNDQWGALRGVALLEPLIANHFRGRIALVSSFGAESAVLLHMIATIDRNTPVLFVDSGKMFDETLAYRDDLVRWLGITNIRVIAPEATDLGNQDPNGDLHQSDPDQCCSVRKVQPLDQALQGFDAWISGRKRFQSNERANLQVFEENRGQIKINPLVDFSIADLGAYIKAHNLPRHPLVAKGFSSIGCAPCTTAVAPGEDIRAGRWRGANKTECGLHGRSESIPFTHQETEAEVRSI